MSDQTEISIRCEQCHAVMATASKPAEGGSIWDRAEGRMSPARTLSSQTHRRSGACMDGSPRGEIPASSVCP